MSTLAQSAYDAGFGPVMVPVTRAGEPYTAPLDSKDMGKAPGVKPNGHWRAIPTTTATCGTRQSAGVWDGWHANIGIACGRDAHLMAIDSDCDDRDLADLIRGIVTAYVPNSPSRYVDCGFHHRFLIPVRIAGDVMPKGASLRFGKGPLAFGIDFLGEGKQFVAFGSHAGTGYPYAWTQDILSQIDGPWLFPEITAETLTNIMIALEAALAQRGWKLVSGHIPSQSYAQPVDIAPVTEPELRPWLALIPNTDKDTRFDSYQDFVTMAHAIWGASSGLSCGRDVWTEWCNQRLQGTDGIADRIWDSIKDTRVGLDWIRSRAAEVNPNGAAQLAFEDCPINEDEAGAAEQAVGGIPLWPMLRDQYIWIEAQGAFFNMVSGNILTRGVLDLHLADIAARLQRELTPGVRGRQTASQLISAQPDLIKVDNLTYWPGEQRFMTSPEGRPLLNMWRPAPLTRRTVSAQAAQLWHDHVEYVTGSKADADLLVKWLAFVVKLPREKPNWHPLIMTMPGIGKDSLLAPVIPAVGAKNCTSVNATDMSRNWTAYLESRLIYVSEARQQGGSEKSPHAVMNEIKQYLTMPPSMVGVERKGRDKYQVANLSAWVFFSNERAPLFLDDSDRRLWVIENFTAQPQSPAYYIAFHEWLKDNPDTVANYLLDYHLTAQDIDTIKGVAPATSAKQSIIQVNRDPIKVAVEEMIEEARHGAHFPVLIVAMEDMIGVVGAKLPKGKAPTSTALAFRLKEAGALPVAVGPNGEARVVRVSSTKFKRLWVLAPTDENGRVYSGLTGAQAAKLYNDAKWPSAPRQTSTGVPIDVVASDSVV